jgi:hypothetical protein
MPFTERAAVERRTPTSAKRAASSRALLAFEP